MNETAPPATFEKPPTIVDVSLLAVLHCPPPTNEY
jgi:hypothetical protein